MNKPEPSTQEIRDQLFRLTCKIKCVSPGYADALKDLTDALLKRLEVRERTSQFHKSNHLAAEKRIEELKVQLAMVHRVSGCDQFRCVFSSQQDHCPEAIINKENSSDKTNKQLAEIAELRDYCAATIQENRTEANIHFVADIQIRLDAILRKGEEDE